MSNLELIDRLCAVTSELSRIVREQATFIENCLSVDAESKKHFAALREKAEAELDLIEYELRPIHNTGSDGGRGGENAEMD